MDVWQENTPFCHAICRLGKENAQGLKKMNVQDFIKQLYIKEIGEIKNEHPYMAYMVMGAGIEFLGKVLAQPSRNDWFEDGHSRADFENAVSSLPGLSRYNVIKNDLYKQLRCGLLHSSLPNANIKLGDNNAVENITTAPYILNIDVFYDAFKTACDDVVSKVDAKTLSITDEFLDVEERVIQVPQNEDVDDASVEPHGTLSAVTSLSGCCVRPQT